MRAYASEQIKKPQPPIEALPKVKPTPNDPQTRRDQPQSHPQQQSGIKGIIGQAVSFYSHNNLSMKIKSKHTFDSTIKSIFSLSASLKKDGRGVQRAEESFGEGDEGEGEGQGNGKDGKGKEEGSLGDYVASLRQNYKKSKYFAFQRLVKMNSESYGAYNNWLKQKRKISPLMFKLKSTQKKNLEASQICQTLTSNEQQPTIQHPQPNKNLTKKQQKTLDKLLKKDIRLHSKQRSLHHGESFQQLFVTRTNLIRKIATNLQTNTKKLSSIKYPERNGYRYKFYLGPGNNHEIISRVLTETRGANWTATTEYDTLFNLKWEQYSDKSVYRGLDFQRYRQLINHFQFHQAISTKAGLIETLKQYWAKLGHPMDVFLWVPMTFVFDWGDKGKFQDELKKFVYCYCENHPDTEHALKMERDFVQLSRYLWKGFKQPPNMSFDRPSLKRQSIPQFPPIFKQQNSKYLWIIKPSDYNRGRGIKIFSTLEELGQIIKDSMPTDTFVIQKYIERPLLIRERKFDIRVWVMVSQDCQAYFFEQGYIRTSCETFSLDYLNTETQYIHLTNNAVQKNSTKYGTYEQGNQLSFDGMDEALKKQPGNFKNIYLPDIKRICAMVLDAGMGKIAGEEKVRHKLNSLYIREMYRVRARVQGQGQGQGGEGAEGVERVSLPLINSPSKAEKEQKGAGRKGSSFEIFGFDFMVDREEKIWLIEVNTNPCLQTSSRILQLLIPRMLDDAFKIILDPIFKPSPKPQKSPYEVPGYPAHQNMWSPLSRAPKS